MKAKKLALVGVASMAIMGASISIAGGPANQMPVADDPSGIYIGVDAGAIYNSTLDKTVREWAVVDGDTYANGFTFNGKKHTPWGWTVSGLVGYQFNHNWALQVGYIWAQTQKANYYNNTKTDYYKFKQYHWYAGLKGMLPLMGQLSGYMMVGAAYNHQTLDEEYSTGATATDLKYSYWSPLGAVGVAYNLTQNLGLNVQYMYIMGKTTLPLDTVEHAIMGASSQRITLGVNYLFTI